MTIHIIDILILIITYLFIIIQNFPMSNPAPPPHKTVKVYEEQGNGFYLAQFKTGELAIFSYYIQSNKQALIIDPTYDVAVYEEISKARQSKINAVALTHYHADYLAGHLEFGLPVFMGQSSPRQNTTFKICEYKDNSSFKIGDVSIKVLHTPGHTMQSSVFVLSDKKGKEIGAFTGDTIFLGQIGRPDLAVSEKCSKQDLARMLFASIQKCKKQLGDDVKIFPGHGAGSSCGKSICQGNVCTMGTQKEKNYALKINDQNQFVKTILNQMPKPPSYFFHDAKINQTGSNTFSETQKKVARALTVEQFAKQIANGATVIDSRIENVGGCIEGSLLMHEGGTLAVWVGDMLSADTKILLFCQKGKHEDFIARILRIGYFNILGYNDFTIEDWKAKGHKTYEFKQVTAKQLAQLTDYSLLDVRKPGQWKQTGIATGSKLIVLSELPQRWAEVKDMKNIYINCRSGWRAKLAMSILHNNGIQSSVVADKFLNFADSGIKVSPYQ